MGKKTSKSTIVESERQAWTEVVKRLDFLVAASEHNDKDLLAAAAGKTAEALQKFAPLHNQRMQAEFGDKA